MKKKKIIRSSTIPVSLAVFCDGMLKKLSKDYDVVCVSSPGEAMKTLRDREGVRTIEVPMERHISLFKDLVSLFRLIGVFIKERPTMVHSITPKAGLLSMIAAWLTRVPVRVHTFTGLVFPTATGLSRRILMFTDSVTCFCATHVIPEGEGVKNDLQNYHITKKPLEVLGFGNVRGVDMEYYDKSRVKDERDSIVTKYGLSDCFTFVFVGRLVRDKGMNELVEAFSKLNQENPDTRLLLVGPYENDLDPILPDTQKQINENPNIISVGRQSDVRPWYTASDCFVFPSYREGFPNTVLEAGALGLPSIVTDINGSREIIIEGVNGVIIPSKDVDALYEAMKNMYVNREDTQRMAANARHNIENRFEKSFVQGCQIAFYKDVLGNV